MKKIKINNKIISEDSACFTVAEAGANHDGKVEKAFKLIDAAIKAQADSIKFQTYKASKLTTKSAPKYWHDQNNNETQYDVFKKLDTLENDDWEQIFGYAKKKNLTCFSTPFDEQSADFLYSLDVPAFKIASADITHIPLIKHIAAKNLPVFISTGMASDIEIEEAVHAIEDEGNSDIIIMHCMTSYPTKVEDANLEIINTLKKKYPNYIIGYSDHTLGTAVAAWSIFYGAKVIEKHFTFDTLLEDSPDHRLSLDAKGFSELVNNIRSAELSKGKSYRQNFDCESDSIKYARRSIVTTTKIKKGTMITREMIGIKRPATGIYPKYIDKVVGSVALQDIEEDTPIQWNYISK